MQIKEILDSFEEEREVLASGRVILLRPHGGSCFAHIKDGSGRIQIYGRKDKLDNFNEFTKLKLGDIISVSGRLFITKTMEKTIEVSQFSILSIAKNPVPKEWYGIADIEIRHRKRYLDLLVNEEKREIFEKRSKIIKAIREFLDEKGFLEVETPMMQILPGGAEAEPFKTHHNALDLPLYLRIAPELFLKRLIVGGFDRVYEIGKNFRNEGISTLHNPEFTMLEAYLAYADYKDIMTLTEELIFYVVKNPKITYDNYEIDLTPPFKRLSLFPALEEATGEKICSMADIDALVSKLGMDVLNKLNALIDKFIVPNLIQPTFLIDWPVEVSPLAKKGENPNLVERFELFIGGYEIGNAYSELTDSDEQLKNFKKQGKIDYDYIEALSYGMPPTGGLGIGIDRLVMLLTGQTSIREVILFPLLRPL
ncbi:MAG: lysine--tRNA ligase [bacterium]